MSAVRAPVPFYLPLPPAPSTSSRLLKRYSLTDASSFPRGARDGGLPELRDPSVGPVLAHGCGGMSADERWCRGRSAGTRRFVTTKWKLSPGSDARTRHPRRRMRAPRHTLTASRLNAGILGSCSFFFRLLVAFTVLHLLRFFIFYLPSYVQYGLHRVTFLFCSQCISTFWSSGWSNRCESISAADTVVQKRQYKLRPRQNIR